MKLTAIALAAGLLSSSLVAGRPETLRDAALDDDVGYAIVEGLTTEIGPRLAGTEAEARARTWAIARLKGLGFANVHVEPFDMPVWVRGAETAEIVSPFPQTLRLTALGNSAATPPQGLTAPVAFFNSFDALVAAAPGSLAGKIAFVSNAMRPTQDGSGYGVAGKARFRGPQEAAKRGAAAIVIRSIGTDHGRGPHAGVTDFEPGTASIPAAALSVADAEQLERIVAAGKPVSLHLTLTPRMIGTRRSGNVVAEVPGRERQAGVVLVGGHLDSWDLGTGAIDDGAGIAIVTAAARRLLDGPRPRRTVRVVWFGAEEVGGFGGIAYAKAHAGERHAAASEADFGADRVWKMETNLPPSAQPIAARLAIALEPLGIVPGRGIAGNGTDVGPTLRSGVAAIDLNQSGLHYFDWHHTPEDTLDRIDKSELRQATAAWTAMLAIVADAPEEIGAVRPRPETE